MNDGPIYNCPVCGEPIYRGETIVLVNGKYAHPACRKGNIVPKPQ